MWAIKLKKLFVANEQNKKTNDEEEDFDDHIKMANSLNKSIIGLNFSKPIDLQWQQNVMTTTL